MTAPLSLILWALGLTLIFIVLPVVAMWSVAGLTTRAVRSFRCPLLARGVEVEFEEELWDGQRREIIRCSEFPESAVTCDKACLRTETLPSARELAMRAD